jgi:abortive infection bacteriophage resistance protein
MSSYSKPFLSFEQQLALLKTRGLIVTDHQTAIDYLSRVGYYHLSAYWYSLRKRSPDQSAPRLDTFIQNASFQHVAELYVFDKKLRLLILDAIERIEVALRVDIAYLLGEKDAFAHTRADLLHGNFTKKINTKTGKSRYQDWLTKHDELVKRSKEDFVRHYREKYGFPLPIWVSVELWDFGLLSTFYQGMSIADKSIIANKYGITDCALMESWLRTLNFVRNVSAHHSRLWNKNLIDQPKMPKTGEISAFDPLLNQPNIASRLYGALCILVHFLAHLCPHSSWPTRLHELILSFPDIPNIGIQHMGFPANWEQHAFWQTQPKTTQS